MNSRERRTRNELLIEADNRRLKQMAQHLLDKQSKEELALNFTCECAELECRESIPLSVDEYTVAHQRGDYFVVKPGHEQSDIERTVMCYPSPDNPEYCVVEKFLLDPDSRKPSLH